ncbi:MAG: hypothetical protein ACTHM1_06005 [Solirubrobacteraceae bacterium]
MTGSDGDAPEQQTEQTTPGFGERGRMRRRARFLRKARELAYRDLGGLVFDLHRFAQRNDEVLSAKLATLTQMDAELRGLEKALAQRQSVTVLREVGIAACPRCAAIHGRDDRFCPGCGLPFDANAERPLATAPAAPLATPPASPPATAHPPEPPTRTPTETPAPTPSAPTAPPVKPTAQPVAAPAATSPPKEDEPTQILRPPVTGAQG